MEDVDVVVAVGSFFAVAAVTVAVRPRRCVDGFGAHCDRNALVRDSIIMLLFYSSFVRESP